MIDCGISKQLLEGFYKGTNQAENF